MSVHTFYRLAAWFPLVLPTLTVVLHHGLGYRVEEPLARKAVHLLLMMFVGGVPYVPIALVATFWIGGRSEGEIKRAALLAPLFMIVPYALVSMYLLARSGSREMSMAVFLGGSFLSVVLGYPCVALVFACRHALGAIGLLPALDSGGLTLRA